MRPFPETEMIDAALAMLQAGCEPLEDRHGPNGRVRIMDGPRQWVFDIEGKHRANRAAILPGAQGLIEVLDVFWGFPHEPEAPESGGFNQ